MLENYNKNNKTKYTSKFSIIFFIFALFQLINKSLAECPRDRPILISNECKMQYCSQEQFNSSYCKIDNSIVKTQWLNNIIQIGPLNYRYINFASYSNGDMVVETTSFPSDPKRYFYGLKNDGRPFFTDKNTHEETPSYVIETNYQNKNKYESQAIIIKSSENGEDNGKEYFLSVSKLDAYAELFDFNKDKIHYKTLKEFTGKDYINTHRHSFFFYKNSSNNYCYIFGFTNGNNPQNKNINFQKHIFDSINSFEYINSNRDNIQPINNGYGKMISSFKTPRGLIISFFLIKIDKIYFNIRKYNEDFSNPIDFNFENTIDNDEVYYKCVHLKGEIGAFSYYQMKNGVPYPIIMFKEFNIEENRFKNYLSSKYENSEILLNQKIFHPPAIINDLIKMNDNKVCFGAVNSNKDFLFIVLINIFGNNLAKIRFYSLPMFSLYKYKVLFDLRIHNYNNFLAVGTSYCPNQQCDDNSYDHYSALIIFSYPNSLDTEFNLENYLFDNNNVTFNHVEIDLKKYLIFQNNIFGYILNNVRIREILNCGDYKFFLSTDEDIPILGYYNLNKDENIIIKYKGEGNVYPILNCIVKYSFIATEPDLNNYDIYPEIKFGDEDNEELFEKFQYEGRVSNFAIKMNNILTSDCPNNCDLCLYSNKEYCITCKYNYSLTIENGITTKICYENQILTTIPTTITTTVPTTISTTVPTTIPTSITTTIPNKIASTIPSIISSTMPITIPATNPSIISTKISSTDLTIGQTNEKDSELITEQVKDTITNKNIFDEYSSIINSNNDNELITNKIIDKSSVFEETETIKCTTNDILSNKCQKEVITDEQIKELNEKIKETYLSKEYNGKNNIIITENVVFQVTKLNNQTFPNSTDVSTVDLGDCQKKLKEFYKIPEKESLIIYKTDIKTSDLIHSYIQYEIYNPLKLERLNLSICYDSKITINSKINLDESTISLYNSLMNSGYNLFDQNNSFYKDICSTYTSQNGTDMTLTDRRNEFFYNSANFSLCQTGCELKEFNSLTKYIKCDCQPQINEIEALLGSSEEKFIMEMVKDSIFTTIKNSNLLILKCSKLVLDTSTLFKNYGRILMTVVIFVSLISFFVLIFKDFKKFDTFILSILNNNMNNTNQNEDFQKIKTKGKKKKSKIKKGGSKKRLNTMGNKKCKILAEKLMQNNNENKSVKPKKKKLAPPRKHILSLDKSLKKNNISKFENDMSSKYFITEHNIKNRKIKKMKNKKVNNKNSNINIIKIKNLQIKKYMSQKNIIQQKSDSIYNHSYLDKNERVDLNKKMGFNLKRLNDQELNSLEYEQAKEFDKRTYSQYYISLLKKKQLILFTFCPANDYNLFSVKICLFLTNFSLYLTINCFFFSDETMHKIYIDNGDYNFLYQLPQIIYTSIISTFVNILLKQLSLSEKNFLELKQEKTPIRIASKSKNIKACLKIKFLFFFIINYLLLAFFWYFISCFCAVFINTQIILFSDTLISFGLSLLYPFGYYLIPGFFRIPALRSNKNDKKCLYTTGSILALI